MALTPHGKEVTPRTTDNLFVAQTQYMPQLALQAGEGRQVVAVQELFGIGRHEAAIAL